MAVLQCSQLTASQGWGLQPQPSWIKDIFSTADISLDVHIRSKTMIFEMLGRLSKHRTQPRIRTTPSTTETELARQLQEEIFYVQLLVKEIFTEGMEIVN